MVNVGWIYASTPRFEGQLNVDNVFDKDYYVSSYTDEWVQPGEPLKATLSMTWNF